MTKLILWNPIAHSFQDNDFNCTPKQRLYCGIVHEWSKEMLGQIIVLNLNV